MAEQNTKREQILRATLELILENGLQAASMSLISRRAEVPVGTIYRIFPGKEALVNALYQECRDLLFASITDPQGRICRPGRHSMPCSDGISAQHWNTGRSSSLWSSTIFRR